jgi:ligand-binding SRPBCC domain-containing protein
MKTHTVRFTSWLPRSIEEVFDFFSNARNLEQITPPWLKFQVMNREAITMATGTRIAYRLRLRGIPIRWESEITAWEPPYRFVDEQRRGPYRYWKHEHRFASRGNGTEVTDEVEYAVLGGTLVNSLIVAPDVQKIFRFRQDKLASIFK